jgi:hypothetical protein
LPGVLVVVVVVLVLVVLLLVLLPLLLLLPSLLSLPRVAIRSTVETETLQVECQAHRHRTWNYLKWKGGK